LLRKNKTLLIVAGPTAVGQTDLCINLAKKFNTNIISADSRQSYNEINIGTAKPSKTQLAEVPHYFIDSLSIHQDYDGGKFEMDALQLLDRLFLHLDLVIMTGGSGLYLDAVIKGFDAMPAVDPSVRAALNETYEKEGLVTLQKKLLDVDPAYYQKVDLNNPQRLIRALEVYLSSGKPYSSFRKQQVTPRPFNTIKIALDRDREELYRRIDQRMDEMIAEGLFDEATALYPHRSHNALQTVGYKEIFGYLDGKYDKEEAVRLLKRNSRRYAKRQMTWFRKDESYQWFHPSQTQEIIEYVLRSQ